MVSEQKKQYMKQYNKRDEVKAKKAEYMRHKRANEDKAASRRLVSLFLDLGYEDMAYETALERAPEMLVTVKARAQKPQK